MVVEVCSRIVFNLLVVGRTASTSVPCAKIFWALLLVTVLCQRKLTPSTLAIESYSEALK